MFNRFKRRPLLTSLCFLQFLFLSTYTFIFYQNNHRTETNDEPDSINLLSPPDGLPATLIEQNERPFLHSNDNKRRLNHFQSRHSAQLHGRRSAPVNVSTVTESDMLLVECPLLPDNLGKSLLIVVISTRFHRRHCLVQQRTRRFVVRVLLSLRRVASVFNFVVFLVGRVEADLYSYTIDEVEQHYINSSIELGGHWRPSQCTSRYRVAIIIPFRNREMQLRIFLNFMHSFLQKQQLDYQIFLIEPVSRQTNPIEIVRDVCDGLDS
jgi:hypothetical protein